MFMLCSLMINGMDSPLMRFKLAQETRGEVITHTYNYIIHRKHIIYIQCCVIYTQKLNFEGHPRIAIHLSGLHGNESIL